MHIVRRVVPFFILALTFVLPAPFAAHAQDAAITVSIAPPPIPVYSEPPLPDDGYLFVPGYWAWGPGGYYWVPGTWVMPPDPNLLWTPGYWDFDGGVYVWHAGYWGPTVGYYGGIDYGFGYYGDGYAGGRWQDGHFYYNSAVHNFGRVHVAHAYSERVAAPSGASRASFAGQRGSAARPNAAQQPAQHRAATAEQQQHESTARGNFSSLAQSNHGRPAIAATPRAGAFTGAGIVHAAAANTRAARPAPAAHAAPQARPAHAAPRAAPAHAAPRATPAHAAPAARPAQGAGHPAPGGKGRPAPGKPDDHP